ncbi:hypothetical protein GA0074692_6777 [Micromonospora pallida]|uniref:Uncharacterized protein n=1 Tax=Micromonospora pallida TaxID=145854 RepID=A0A1C6TNG0_9ACTN|nr:hypothetical protein [Micromonospora pallida]SCL43132.1 hypothetical protein GA0074692_6726 [Micromonospora pallida]SCL43230.1 hypothetical protein GA0074692_6777 [Micromonospora pallida]
MVPDYRYASPGPVPDGDTVPQPPRPVQSPVTRRQYASGLACALIVLVLVVVGIAW